MSARRSKRPRLRARWARYADELVPTTAPRRIGRRQSKGDSQTAPESTEGDSEDDDEPIGIGGPARKEGWYRGLSGFLWTLLDRFKGDLTLIVAASVFGVVRAMGVTVESGWTGLQFTFGRARRELAPGFHWLIPFAQSARKVPTRSRTMDLPVQRVTTHDGLVYLVDANLVFRITDVRRALIQVDDLERGMRQVLGLAVQNIVRSASGAECNTSGALDGRLVEALERRLEVWGVTVESAGFPSIRPSPRTLRITQLERTVTERREQWLRMRGALGESAGALGLVGTKRIPRPRARALRRYLRVHRRMLALARALQARGWNGAEIKRAERRAFDHSGAQRRSGVLLRNA